VVPVGVALDQLLLRERDELARRDGEAALDRADGGEGPARSAALLILHLGHRALGHPVYFGGQRQRVRVVLEVDAPRVLGVAVEEELGHDRGRELLPGHVRPLVVAQRVGRVLAVVHVDDGVVGGEGGERAGLGVGARVGLAVVILPLVELVDEAVAREGERAGHDGEHGCCVGVGRRSGGVSGCVQLGHNAG